MLPACLTSRGGCEPWGIKATGVACAIHRSGRTTSSFPDSDQDAEDWETPLSGNRSQLPFRSSLLYSCSHELPSAKHTTTPWTHSSFSEHPRMPTMCLASNEGQRMIQLCRASQGKGPRGLAGRMPIASHSTHFYVLRCSIAQSHPILCNPMGCSPLGSSVHGMSQARILEWDAISFSKLYTYINLLFFR